MTISSIADLCRFTPTAGALTDWTFSAVAGGFIAPSVALGSGQQYSYRAESADLSQWEVGTGVYTAGSPGVIARTNILFNSAGTGTAQGGAGTKINFSAAPTVGIAPLAEDLQPRFAYVVTGLDNTGATDVGTALNAFIQTTPLYSLIILPIGIYSTTTTILVNGGRTMVGMSGGLQAGTTDAGACIKGSLTLSPVVKVDGGLGSQSCNLKNINITRVTGTFAISVIGLQLWRVNNGTFEDLFVSRHGIGIDLLDANVTIRFRSCTVFAVNQFYMAMHGTAVEISSHLCRFGINGGIDLACTGYLFMDGGGWDTIRFENCQWNCSIAGGVQHGIYFNAYNASNPNGIFRMDLMHVEGVTNDFIVGVSCTAKIPRFSIHNSQINSPGVPFCASASMFQEWSLIGTDINMNVTLDTWSNGRMAGCLVSGTVVLNALNGTLITGNLFYTNTTLQGSCPKSAFVGNSVNGTFTNTSTGAPVVANNA